MKLNCIYIFGIVLYALITQACDKMNDLHQSYIDEGETVYAAKIDSVIFHPGNERIKLEIFISSQRIELVRVFWNNYTDSADVIVQQQTGVYETELKNLNEGSCIFHFISFDKFTNKSLIYEDEAEVYGEIFQSKISDLAREILSVTPLENGEIIINWSESVPYGVHDDLIYTNIAGSQDTLIIPMSEKTTFLSNVDLTKGLKYRTAFLPEETAIDIFYSNYIYFPIAVD